MNTVIVENLTNAFFENRTDTALPLITIYNSPTDFANKYVARIHVIEGGISTPLVYAALANSMDDLREKIPPHLTCIPRDAHDDQSIVESWV